MVKARIDRIKKQSKDFADLLDQQQKACQAELEALVASIRAIQGSTADIRFQRLAAQLRALGERLELLASMGRRDFLAKIEREADELLLRTADARAGRIMTALMAEPALPLNHFCERMLDLLNEAIGAERGFVLFYLPESSEADVIAARNFQTKNLSLEEYDFSRTLLREVFKRGGTLLLEDASNDPAYSRERSVINFQLKSVLAAPLKDGDRTVGAVYLENNTRPRVFDQDDPALVESVARFACFYFHHAGLLPAAFEPDNRVFLDASKASREIIGQDPTILALQTMISRIADSPATVLIEGESGTGKELVARALHYQSARRDRPFVAINCAAIPDNLLESELFGHEKGAFTGATERYIGRIEQGSGGTIFLDEVSELAYPLQAKLLRFLQSSELSRLGGKETIQVNARIVAATSKDLKAMMEAGKFQDALYYRLNVVPIRVPPLRERTSDIPTLMDFFLHRFCETYQRRIRVDREVYTYLSDYSFQGNVRELENLMHRLVALANDDVITLGDLPKEILGVNSERVSLAKDPLYELLQTQASDLEDLHRRRREVRRALAVQEKQLVERAIEEAGGNLTEAAARLGVHRITLHKMIKRGSDSI